ncbi:MAG: hypothetical protein ABFC80_03780 [Coriobacteriales bacterium]
MDWTQAWHKALWTFLEAFLGVVVVFLSGVSAAWVDSGAFGIPEAAVIALAAGTVGAVALAITVLKEWLLHKTGSTSG